MLRRLLVLLLLAPTLHAARKIDLLITGGREGYLQILDARTGTLLWKATVGAQVRQNPITYAVNGKQYVAAIAGLTLFVFALP